MSRPLQAFLVGFVLGFGSLRVWRWWRDVQPQLPEPPACMVDGRPAYYVVAIDLASAEAPWPEHAILSDA